MPYLIETKTGDDARDACALGPPFGPAINSRDVVRLEIWGSAITDPGDDWCEFRIVFNDGREHIVRLAGY